MFLQLEKSHQKLDKKGLINGKPCPRNPSLRVPENIEKKILYLRTIYHLGPQRISWFLERYPEPRSQDPGYKRLEGPNGPGKDHWSERYPKGPGR
jgi:hypothetical protein